MKNLQTGEITPPLPHDEYVKQAQEAAEAERADKERTTTARAKPAVKAGATHGATGHADKK